ncbi:MAG: hypothetical protein A07HR67_00855 [uncultured archaeon A07HR67]|nr:MAG: hypothetical protein A07HR67_00855 [uncultured archaeon A07HR67]
MDAEFVDRTRSGDPLSAGWVSFGVSGDLRDETTLDAVDRVLGASGVPVGSLAVTDEGVERWIQQGFAG